MAEHLSVARVRRIRSFFSANRVVLSVCLAVLILDQATKHWAVTFLDDGRVIHVVWTLQLNLSFNSGMAFGQGQGWGPVIGVVAMLVVVALVLSMKRSSDRRMAIGTGAIVGGAMGNIIDRLFRDEAWLRGSVVDFIDFQWFPIFNIADMAVNIGGALLVWAYWRSTSPTATR